MFKRKFGFSFILICLYIGGMLLLVKTQENIEKVSFSTHLFEKEGIQNKEEIEVPENQAIGTLKIEKIHLFQNLFAIENSKNNIEQNVTILKESTYPNQEKSQLYIAAHSGIGKTAFFKNLNLLKIGDVFQITFQKKNYIYQIKKIDIQEKDGTISVPTLFTKQATLTTCHPTQKNKQLIVIAKLQKETDS